MQHIRTVNKHHSDIFCNINILNIFFFRTNLSIEFKTSEPDGIIFHAADGRHVDHLVLYMMDGKVTYSFDCGGGADPITSTDTYNDDQWHTVSIYLLLEWFYIDVGYNLLFYNAITRWRIQVVVLKCNNDIMIFSLNLWTFIIMFWFKTDVLHLWTLIFIKWDIISLNFWFSSF